ncbi:hypothetical protein FOZ63_016241 [Perkinsus olseni]|uniref:Uncharacterized protein n=1 Tax=Perkinsus olseni TaxID=32597 RepID=A0A7J6QL08_PEROL|nr:hypothetical protein FOZ63_016241 [Perkinsus olseni]KAF4738965.1 hypothetical protein FOZ62_007561 [Perkinsus olseni]
MQISLLVALFYTCISEDSTADSEESVKVNTAGYPVPVGEIYQKPSGLCAKFNDRVRGCHCDYLSDPITFTKAGYSIGAICASKMCWSSSDCPPGPNGAVQVCTGQRCRLRCQKDYHCPWPARCEQTQYLGKVCYFPQWQD